MGRYRVVNRKGDKALGSNRVSGVEKAMKELLWSSPVKMPETKVSIVIPTLDNAEMLEKCLASVRANNSRYAYEIIVVDAGSTDGSMEVAKKYADKVLNGTPFSINRNKGIEEAKGEIICCTEK